VDDVTGNNHDSATPQAKDAASRATEAVSSQASELKDAAKDHAGAVVTEAREQARNVMNDARDQLQQQADQQARRAGDGLHAASDQLRSMADAGQPGVVTDLTRQLAGGLERVSDRIGEGGLKAVGDDLRSFARRQPGLFLLGAGVAGFLAARAIRASGTPSSGAEPEAPSARPAAIPAAPTIDPFGSTPAPSSTVGAGVTPEPASVR